MLRISLTMIIIGLLSLFPLVNNNAYAQGGASKCEKFMSCQADNDYGNYPIASTDYYYPCNNWLTWTFEFHRTVNTNNRAGLQFHILGAEVIRQYYARDHSEGDYSYFREKAIDPRIQNKIIVSRIGAPGYFENIKAIAKYYAKPSQ